MTLTKKKGSESPSLTKLKHHTSQSFYQVKQKKYGYSRNHSVMGLNEDIDTIV